MTERAFERVPRQRGRHAHPGCPPGGPGEAAVRKAQEQQRGGVMANTAARPALPGAPVRQASTTTTGTRTAMSSAGASCSQAAQPCGLDECDCHLHAG